MNVQDQVAEVPKSVPLEADCVFKHYGERRVLTSASLRAVPGVITGLLGRNGAGKTTLLRILTGELAPDNGVVRVDGVGELRVHLASLARRGVFYLPARDLLLRRLSVIAQLRAVQATFGVHNDLQQIATLLGIAGRLQQRVSALSGGERRRAEFALALVRAPRVIVADEPLRGVTPLDADVLMGALRTFVQGGGAVIVTGHELPLLLPHLDRVLWCHAGRTREFASVQHAQRDFAFRRDFLPNG